MILRWFAFTCVPGREKAALAELAVFAQATRLPMGMKEIARGRGASKTRKRTWPLMAGYAFGAYAGPQALTDTLAFIARAKREEIPHALRNILATAAGVAIELKPDRHNRAWFEQMDYSTVELPQGETRPLSWAKDDPVKLTEGPFADIPGVVERVNGERAIVVVEIFARMTRVDVSVRELVRSSPVPVDGAGRRSA